MSLSERRNRKGGEETNIRNKKMMAKIQKNKKQIKRQIKIKFFINDLL